MTIGSNNKPNSRAHGTQHITSLVTFLLLAVIVASSFFALAHPGTVTKADAAASFGFTALGDYDQTTQTAANLKYIAGSRVNFNLAVGDFSYLANPTSTQAAQWSTYVKSTLPTNFPFEIVDGRHDSGQIKTYETNLPDHIGDVSATCATCAYGQQYYFDYPPTAPLARIIMLSPNQTIAGYSYDYDKGSPNYQWVSDTIDAARAAHIQWVIVGMHEYCFVIGTAKCLDQQLLDLLLSKHVDLILQGQKHNYQASKQLALNSTTCLSLDTARFNAGCVVNSTNHMAQGAGSVIVVTGTGGASQLAINSSDPKYAYFRTSTPTNNVTWGVSQFTLSSTQLTERFVPTSGGNFADNFTITKGASTPTPTATKGTTLAQDTFARPDQAYWGTASDGQSWGANANSSNVFSIKSGIGQVVATSTTNYYATLGPAATDAKVQYTGAISTYGGATIGAILRWTNAQNWYSAYIDGTNLVIAKKVGNVFKKLGTIPFAAATGGGYTLLFSAVGSTLSASVWRAGSTPPSTWMVTTTDSSLTTGVNGLHVVVQNGVRINFNAFLATS